MQLVSVGRQRLLWVLLVLALISGVAGSFLPDGIAFLLAEMQVAFAIIHFATWTRWSIAFAALGIVFAVSYLSEFIGTHTGLTFGNYYYSDTLLGPLIGEVPPLIMLAYFSIGYVSYMMARVLVTGGAEAYSAKIRGGRLVVTALLTGLLATMNDLALDPIQSTLLGQWTWEDGGAFFGVPAHNFYGWVGTVFVYSLLIGILLVRTMKTPLFSGALPTGFMIQPAILYAIYAVSVMVKPLLGETGDIYVAMAMLGSIIMVMPVVATLALLIRKRDALA